MTRKKAPTIDELIIASGMNRSPSEIVSDAREEYDKSYSAIFHHSWLRKIRNTYINWRWKDLKWEGYFKLTMISIFVTNASLLFLLAGILIEKKIGYLEYQSGISFIFSYICLMVGLVIIIHRLEYAPRSYVRSFTDRVFYTLRNLFFSSFDLFFLKELRDKSKQVNSVMIITIEPFEPVLLLRKTYTDGLKRVENELIGPNSDWSKTLVDLKDRKEKLERNISRLDNRIAEAKRADDDARYLALTSAKARSTSSQRGLNEAIEAIEGLVKRTRDEINKLYKLVDSMGDVYQDAELIKESDALIAENERAIDYAQQLRDQAYEKITRQLTAVAGVVIGHQLLPDPSVEAIDMPLYLERIEKAAESISKIEEAA